MKYTEFVFLIVVMFLTAYLALNAQDLSGRKFGLILAVIAFASFQFAFRRQMRKKSGPPDDTDKTA